MLNLFIFLIGLFLYCFFAAMVYNIGFSIGPFDNEDIFISFFWPLSLPIILSIFLAKKVVRLFKK